MSSLKHHNITDSFTKELLAAGNNVRVSQISIANIEGTNACAIDLWIEKKLTGTFYYMKQVLVPADTSFIYDLTFDNSANEWGLYIKATPVSGTAAIDVIIS